jgi:hypothetical protein
LELSVSKLRICPHLIRGLKGFKHTNVAKPGRWPNQEGFFNLFNLKIHFNKTFLVFHSEVF